MSFRLFLYLYLNFLPFGVFKNAQKETDTLLKLMEVHVVDETSLAGFSGKPLIIVKRLVMQIQIVFLLRLIKTNAICPHRVLMTLPFQTVSCVFM